MRHWMTRYRIFKALDEGTLAALLGSGAHLSRCGDCQAHARALQALHARLALGAAAAPAPPPRVAAPARGRLLVATPLALAAAAAIYLLFASPSAPDRVE